MHKMRDYVEEQVKWVMRLKYEDIPAEVIVRTKWILLDSVGCILNGLGGKNLPGDENEKILKSSAAMVSTELYEGNRFAIGHPASHIVPILLTEAERRNLSYGEVLRILVCAYEIASRWGSAIRFSNDILGHGTIMISGAAIVEGLLSHIPESDFINYIMVCESIPEVSTWQSVLEGSALHDYFPGIAAVNARNALCMIQDNVYSSEQLVRSVYDKIIGAEVMEEKLGGDLGTNWYLLKNYFKVYTGCRFIHPFADVITGLLREGLKKGDIEEIHIYTYKKASRLVNQTVPNVLAAKFSTPVSLATLIVRGRLYPEDIAAAATDEEVKELSAHIYVEEDDKYNSMLPDIRGGCVKVKKKNGTIIEREIFHAQGDFDHPEQFTEDRLKSKFHDITQKYVNRDRRENIINHILMGTGSSAAAQIFGQYFDIVRQEVL